MSSKKITDYNYVDFSCALHLDREDSLQVAGFRIDDNILIYEPFRFDGETDTDKLASEAIRAIIDFAEHVYTDPPQAKFSESDIVLHLNTTVWATLAPSPIHGIGVFAIRDIPKGQKVFCRGVANQQPIRLDSFEGLAPEIVTLIKQRWPLADKGELFQSPNDDARLISFMNHSDTPNYDHHTDTALSDIKAGEEITENYG